MAADGTCLQQALDAFTAAYAAAEAPGNDCPLLGEGSIVSNAIDAQVNGLVAQLVP